MRRGRSATSVRAFRGPSPRRTSSSWLLSGLKSRRRWGSRVFLFFTRRRPSTGAAICHRPTSGKCSTGLKPGSREQKMENEEHRTGQGQGHGKDEEGEAVLQWA